MKVLLKIFIGVIIIMFSLIGCIGEEYDFTPPSVTLFNSNILLEEANIDWHSDKEYKKETEDILSLAKKQKQTFIAAGQKEEISLDSEDFAVNKLSVSVWQNDQKIDLELQDRSFYFPKETGEYVIEVNLHTDSGFVQYVGNIVLVD